MPRPKTILQNEFPYHVSGRCLNKEWFIVPIDEVWEIYCYQLTYINWVYGAEIHSFVLMDNHFHLLLSTPESNLSVVMANFMKETSRQFNALTGRINQVYGGRHFRSLIESYHYYLHAYKYIYRNPVAAGLVESCEDYKYSSLRYLLGNGKLNFPVAEDPTLFSDIDGTLSWLNDCPDEEDWLIIGEAMKKAKFKIAKSKATKKNSHLEFDML